MAEQKEFSAFAIMGFVLSFLGLFSIVGLVFSIIGILQTRDNKKRGRGLAIAGLIISIIVFIISVIAWVLSFIIMNTPVIPPK